MGVDMDKNPYSCEDVQAFLDLAHSVTDSVTVLPLV